MSNREPNFDNTHEKLIGESLAIKKVVTTAEKIARNPSLTTLITGESGTGKEIVARLVHNAGPSTKQPFVDINCSAIPENLLESELFGYEKGAFTGANNRKQGLFELANGGTIFLDEIGNISTNFQAKLLKVVENKRFRRISGLEEIKVSTRIVAATNVNLDEAVRNGNFREDLYYRLNVYRINLPPLRERGEDSIILAQHFVDHFNQEYDRQIRGLAPSAKKFILNYHWPGNIRELKNAIERAVLVESEEWVEADDLSVDSEQAKPKASSSENVIVTTVDLNLIKFEIPDEGIPLEEIERNIVLSALEKADGNISKAARLLRINRGKFRYRLERLRLSI
ncbi:MAG: AAA family ATPase [Caldithrix sp.]|nr:MAG: AAA family ATPase [Caldithrix sp.]